MQLPLEFQKPILIACTAHLSEDVLKETEAAGFDDTFSVPMTVDLVNKIVKKIEDKQEYIKRKIQMDEMIQNFKFNYLNLA